MLSLPLINNNKKNIELIFIKDHSEEISVNISYDVTKKITFKEALVEVRERLKLPNETKLIVYAASYSSWEYIEEDQSV